jgi:hypothetical protein
LQKAFGNELVALGAQLIQHFCGYQQLRFLSSLGVGEIARANCENSA